jgi:hypothetical protein
MQARRFRDQVVTQAVYWRHSTCDNIKLLFARPQNDVLAYKKVVLD